MGRKSKDSEPLKPRAIIFARVSTQRQEKEGLSIDEIQLPQLKEYAEKKGFQVLPEDIYTIGETGGSYKERKKFDKMIERIKKNRNVKDLIAFRVDRITRCFRDAVCIDGLRINNDLHVHLVDERLILHKNSPSRDLTVWNMKVFIAQEYLNRVKEDGVNTKYAKLERGELPWLAPFGYKNSKTSSGSSTVVPKEPEATIVQEIHRRFSTGVHSCITLANEINKEYGTKMNKGRVHHILVEKFYIGFIHDEKTGKDYPHKYSRLVTNETYEKNQKILQGHRRNRRRFAGIEAVYRGLIDCGIDNCGCSLTPELKKKTQKNGNQHAYMYYHCSGGKKERHPNLKSLPYLKETRVDEAVIKTLRELKPSNERMREIRRELAEVHESKNAFYDGEKKRLTTRQKKLINYKHKTHDAWMEESITRKDYDENMSRYNTELNEIQVKLDNLESADKNYYVTVSYLLDLVEHVGEIYEVAEFEEKRQILGTVFSNLSFDGKNLNLHLKKPFDTILGASNVLCGRGGRT